MFKTMDGGKTWFKQSDTTYQIYNFTGMSFYNENLGFAYGFGSLLVYTKDGGDSWKVLTPESMGVEDIGAIVDIAFFDENYSLLMTTNSFFLLQRQTSGSYELIDDLSNKTDGYIVHKGNNLIMNYESDVKSMELFTLAGQSTPSLLRFTQRNKVITVTFPDNLSSGLYFLLFDTSHGKQFARVIIAD